MQELEPTKGRCVTVPKRAKRYAIAYYINGWHNESGFYTTPEDALESFLRRWNGRLNEEYAPKFYTVYSLDLEIPVM